MTRTRHIEPEELLATEEFVATWGSQVSAVVCPMKRLDDYQWEHPGSFGGTGPFKNKMWGGVHKSHGASTRTECVSAAGCAARSLRCRLPPDPPSPVRA